MHEVTKKILQKDRGGEEERDACPGWNGRVVRTYQGAFRTSSTRSQNAFAGSILKATDNYLDTGRSESVEYDHKGIVG
jgi:hypothetical protein